MMKSVALVLIIISLNFVNANPTTSIAAFLAYSIKAKKEYKLSEKKLLKVGDVYLKHHAFAAERLSLSEMLPTKTKDLSIFCKTYSKEISNYYNLGDVNLVKTIKSPVYAEFYKIVEKECLPFSKSKK